MRSKHAEGADASCRLGQKGISSVARILLDIPRLRQPRVTDRKLYTRSRRKTPDIFLIGIAIVAPQSMVKVGRDDPVIELFSFLKVVECDQQTVGIRATGNGHDDRSAAKRQVKPAPFGHQMSNKG